MKLDQLARIVLFTFLFAMFMAGCVANGQTANRPAKGSNMMKDLTKQELTERAKPLGSPVLTTLEQPQTIVERTETPFLSDGGIYKVSTRPPERPRVYMLGVWGTDEIKVLNGSPENFHELIANGGFSLRSGADHVSYVLAYFEATRDFTGGVQILDSIQHSWWLPNPKDAETIKRNEVIAKYASIVESPRISREDAATVTLYIIRDRKLIRSQAKIESDGAIKFSDTVLEPEMPTVILR